MEYDDDVPHLSAETFAALTEFYKEQEERENKLGSCNEDQNDFQEDWQLSQFWYDEKTINALVEIGLNSVDFKNDVKIALVSCPTLFKKMKQSMPKNGQVTLFEFDKRFASYGSDFTFYDYNKPLEIPQNLRNYYDLVLVDPPFLSEECLSKVSETVKFISTAESKIVLCSGAIMQNLAKQLLNLDKTEFYPQHKNNLGNEFWCYCNFKIPKNILNTYSK